MAITNYLVGDVRESYNYIQTMSRSGCTKMPPLIITCAITGGLHGKEANPNLPETFDEQLQSAIDAYNAGASMIHIHRRDDANPMATTTDYKKYIEFDRALREACPDLIINNTAIGGHMIDIEGNQVYPLSYPSVAAKPEVASLDIMCGSEDMPMKARKAPLFGRDEDGILPFRYIITYDEAIKIAKEMYDNDVLPEYELFGIDNIKYLNRIIKSGIVPENKPLWCSTLFNGNGTFPTLDSMLAISRALPPQSLLNVIGIGPAQFPMLAAAIILGHHVRCGLEDNVMYGPKQPATSNAQMVERVVRLATEIGRPIATPAQAREMMGLGAPRQW